MYIKNFVYFCSMERQKIYEIALTLVPGIGDVNGKKLVAYCGGAEAVFCESRKSLMQIPGIGEQAVNSIVSQRTLLRAEREAVFIDKNDVKPLFYLDADYPKRLQHCHDSPMMLYYKGLADLNAPRSVGIVGTRNITDYGKGVVDKIVGELSSDNVLVVSGLAYGVDTMAHKSALKYNLATVGVLGHGLQIIYPADNYKLAHNMLARGGILTEFLNDTKPDRENFPKRNRIVAGMVDCLIVVESALKGGAMITAEIANSYDREVFAIPGRMGDIYSEGCNNLIKTNRADLMLSADDLRYIMRWDHDAKVIPRQMRLFRDFSEDEKKVVDVFGSDTTVHLDQIIVATELTPTKIASVLLSLEFDGIVTALPGKRYQICDVVK